MEFILVAGAIVFYVLSAIFLKQEQVRKLWLSIFLLTNVVTFGIIVFMHFGQEDFMANAKTMWQLYLIYFNIAVMLAVAVINCWMFRSVVWKVLRGKPVVLETDAEIADQIAEKVVEKEHKH